MPSGVTVHNLDIVIGKLTKLGGGAQAFMSQVLVDAMNEDLWPQWIKHISLDDHTLKDLRELGYPYSKRHGGEAPHPDDMVHIQSGDLMDRSRVQTSSDGLRVQLINDSPHYPALRFGTSKMRIRDPGGAALRDALPAIKARFKEQIQGAVIQYFAK